MTDRDLRLTFITGSLANNMSPQAEPGTSVYDVVGTRDPAHRVIASHLAALLGEPQSFEYNFRGRWYEVFIESLRDESEAIVGCIASAFDITEQRATRERLARSELFLTQAQRVAHVGSFEWDFSSNVLTWSDELHRIYGLEPGQFEGTFDAYLKRVYPDDIEQTKNAIFDAIRTHSPFAFEHRITRTDGCLRVLLSRGDVVADEGGNATRVTGACWDVTELREAMGNLEKARSLLEATIEATADGILVVDLNGRVTAYNPRFLSLWRIPEDVVRQRDDEKLLTYVCDQLRDPDDFMCNTRQIYRQAERESFDMLHFKDGRVFERYSRPQRIGEKIVGRVWSFRDVTEHDKLFRRALFLADATRLLVSLDVEPALDSVAHLAVPFLGDGCAVDLLGSGNPRRLVFVARNGIESLNPELQSSVIAGHSTIFSMGSRSCMAVPLVVKEAVEGSISFIGPPMLRYSNQDLEFAETLASRAALSVENARLFGKVQEALTARNDFLTIAAHEIRGPITSIHLAVQALQSGNIPSATMTRLHEVIERSDRRLSRLVNEMSEFGKIQSGEIDFNLENVDLGDVVREAAATLGPELTRSGSALSVTTESPATGQWDRYRLTQVVTNLLSNAIKFGQGKPISVTVREKAGLTTLEVKDQGIGISPEMLGHIFQPFERAVPVRNYGGLGLGLFIAHTIVKGLGGVIRVESQPERGSTFTVELPSAGTSS
jgi:PAS domain S-box-containing protein